jgi:hypothetical protein
VTVQDKGRRRSDADALRDAAAAARADLAAVLPTLVVAVSDPAVTLRQLLPLLRSVLDAAGHLVALAVLAG